ncbi:MAG: Bug family tripartite tricarboxylate transporter substrate binding protein [Burkholderiaceae bacterium]
MRVHKLIVAAAIMAASFQASAQKAMEIIVPHPPGGSADTMMRMIAPLLADELKQPVIVLNRPGAGAITGTTSFMNSAPTDGSVLLAGYVGTVSINPTLFGEKLPYNPKNLVPVAPVAAIPLFLFVNPKVPARTISEFVAHAKKADLTFASAGVGSANQLAAELLKAQAGVDMLHVPYNGSAPSQVALVGGHVNAMFDTGLAMNYVKDQRLAVLAVSTAKRLPQYPDIPTVAETYPGFEAISWHGLFAQAGTPKPVVDRLNRAVAKALQDPNVQKRFAELQFPVFSLSADQFGEFIERENTKWSDVIRRSGTKAD